MSTHEAPATPRTAAPVRARSRAMTAAAARATGYWIGVISRDHVARGAAGGFAQVSHGKAGPLERMQPGDGLLYYSPREQEGAGAALMAFTAISVIAPGTIDSAQVEGVTLFRRAARYLPATPAPIKPLLPELSFIRSPTPWGAAFRFGFLRVPAHDFARIAQAMGRDPAADFGILPVAAATT